MYSEKTPAQITEKVLARLVAATDITTTSPGTMVRTWTEMMAEAMGTLYAFTSASLAQAYVSTAGGEALDRFGTMFGLSRKIVNPTINASAGAVFFYLTKAGEDVVPGNATEFASANVTIPAGTLIGTDPQRLGSDDPDLFSLVEDVVIPSGSYMAYATVEPVNSIRQTLPSGSVKYHSHTPLTAPQNGAAEDLQINVYNRAELQVNSSSESDTNYRFRIINALNTTTGATAIALRLAALSVQGVRDCKIYPLAHGIGTAKVVVVLEDPAGSTATTIFQSAIDAITSKAAVGDVLDIIRPIESSVDMSISLKFKGDSYDYEVAARAQAATIAYINSLSVGDTLSITRIYGIITSLSPKIVGASVVDNTFAVDGRSVIVSDYTCTNDQQLFAADVRTV